MKNWPSGSYIVLEGHPIEGDIDLLAIGYKYNKKKFYVLYVTKNVEPPNVTIITRHNGKIQITIQHVGGYQDHR